MSRPPAIPPTVTHDSGPLGEQIKRHPAYGMLRFSRVSGDPGVLFGSEINHMGSIRLYIHSGEEIRNHSRTRYEHENIVPLCEVEMSAAQFAEAITSMNIGAGVPCTLRYLADGKGQRPYIDDKTLVHEQIKTEVKQSVQKVSTELHKVQKAFEEAISGLSQKKQNALKRQMQGVITQFEDNLPYVLDQYQEAVETISVKAKTELDAYTTHVVTQLGLDALKTAQTARPLLGDSVESNK